MNNKFNTLINGIKCYIDQFKKISNIENDIGYITKKDIPEMNFLDKKNPTGTGSFSMNRMDGSTIGDYSHAEGYNATASAKSSHAEGEDTTASATASHAEGVITTASGDYSHAEGFMTTASGVCSHTEGCQTAASESYSHAEGRNTTASGLYSHTEGAGTIASGESSHAEGSNTTASGQYSHAEGADTKAMGKYSHVEGYKTESTRQSQNVSGEFNIPESYYVSESMKAPIDFGATYVSYSKNFTFNKDTGLFTLTDAKRTNIFSTTNRPEGAYFATSSTASEIYYIESWHGTVTQNGVFTPSVNYVKYSLGSDTKGQYIHIVGNGTADNARSNAHTLDWDGNAWYAGNIYVGSTSGTNKDEGSKRLATEEFVLNNAGSGSSSSVQADWNQNDETAADYVKNRICYKETKPLDMEGMAFSLDESMNCYFGGLEVKKENIDVNLFSELIGQQRTIVIDGAEYLGTVRLLDMGIAKMFIVGNGSLAGVDDVDAELPILALYAYSEEVDCTIQIATTQSGDTHDIYVDLPYTEYKKLPIAYENTIGRTRESVTELYGTDILEQFSVLKTPSDGESLCKAREWPTSVPVCMNSYGVLEVPVANLPVTNHNYTYSESSFASVGDEITAEDVAITYQDNLFPMMNFGYDKHTYDVRLNHCEHTDDSSNWVYSYTGIVVTFDSKVITIILEHNGIEANTFTAKFKRVF